MTKRALPKRLYVIRENEGSESESYLAAETAAELAAVGESKATGVYMLVEIGTVQAPPAFIEGKHKP